MKVLTAEEMRSADRATFDELGIPSRVVMENAGREVASFVLREFPAHASVGVLVLCGGGNNGGDGYVAARSLLNNGVRVRVGALRKLDELSGDVLENANAFRRMGGDIFDIEEDRWPTKELILGLESSGVVVDAIYGTGLKGEVREFPSKIISLLNQYSLVSDITVVAVDMPSGVDADTGGVLGAAVSSDCTLALQCPKLGHVLFPGSSYCGEVFVSDIGVSLFCEVVGQVRRELILEDDAFVMLSAAYGEHPEMHKGEKGHVIVLGGSAGHLGAAKLAANASLMSGAGLVTLVVPRKASLAVAAQLDELMCAGLSEDGDGNFSTDASSEIAALLSGKNAVVLGPGLGEGDGSLELLRAVIGACSETSMPLLIDADGLNLLAANRELLDELSAQVVLTPHPKEMGRLLGCSSEEIQLDRIGSAIELSELTGSWVVLKGARTVIAGPGGIVRINPAAVSTLATAGSGDVLSGIIGAFLGRGMDPGDAAALGVFLHGAAGEVLVSSQQGLCGAVAGDIVGAVPLITNALLAERFYPDPGIRKVLPGSLHIVYPSADENAR